MRSIKVKDCMTPQVITIPATMEVVEAIRILLHNDITALPVVDESGRVVGILSETDCLQGTLMGGYFSQEGGLVGESMNRDVLAVSSNDDIITAYEHFMKAHAFRVPVVDDGVLVGMLSPKDVMSSVLEFYETPVVQKNDVRDLANKPVVA
ncbi:CBS domain-containing protein [Endozoicomonas sp. 4G]|uniref:CBS domain-containing protein n=1 Tax=Endozoicomonas sp. 4G TaxID=2872754 RepID=UPI002078BBD2|nr:CBS domain-containing protein [Endozoicomonas sp. 4G]